MADDFNNRYNEQVQSSNMQNSQNAYQGAAQGFNPNMGMPPQETKASAGLAILSYLIPIVGLILYLTKKDTRPKTAKVCGKCALASFIINIVIIGVMYGVMGAAMFSGLADADDAADSSYSDDVRAAKDKNKSNKVSDGTIGDYKCIVKGAEKCKDYAGKDAVLITYDFTNNSKNAISFDVALDAAAYQEGVGLETAILDEDTDLLDVEIKPGVTKEVRKAYLLRNTSSEVEIEMSELISLSDDEIVTKVTL